jgi:hypothetical protein
MSPALSASFCAWLLTVLTAQVPLDGLTGTDTICTPPPRCQDNAIAGLAPNFAMVAPWGKSPPLGV